ncbi:MAG: FKBP-type peptidyl-prolyl cis-trans isomerase, partial [Limisphaerales bacterium]
LQYKVIKSGTGESPKLTDTVKVHYQGTLTDGTIFDSSIQRGQPVSFPVNRVIPGWTEALQLMKVGDKWQLFIPAKLAYGDQSPTAAIPPNSVLIFEVELLGIEK